MASLLAAHRAPAPALLPAESPPGANAQSLFQLSTVQESDAAAAAQPALASVEHGARAARGRRSSHRHLVEATKAAAAEAAKAAAAAAAAAAAMAEEADSADSPRSPASSYYDDSSDEERMAADHAERMAEAGYLGPEAMRAKLKELQAKVMETAGWPFPSPFDALSAKRPRVDSGSTADHCADVRDDLVARLRGMMEQCFPESEIARDPLLREGAQCCRETLAFLEGLPRYASAQSRSPCVATTLPDTVVTPTVPITVVKPTVPYIVMKPTVPDEVEIDAESAGASFARVTMWHCSRLFLFVRLCLLTAAVARSHPLGLVSRGGQDAFLQSPRTRGFSRAVRRRRQWNNARARPAQVLRTHDRVL